MGLTGVKEEDGDDIDLEREVDKAVLDLEMFSLFVGRNCFNEDEEKTALKGLGFSC